MKNAAGPRSFVPIQIALESHKYQVKDSRSIWEKGIRPQSMQGEHVLDCLVSRIGNGTTSDILIVLQEVGHLVLLYSRPSRW